MSQTGWYPDPGGQVGKFRYWNGSAWSSELSDSPTAPTPGSVPLGGTPGGGFVSGGYGQAAGAQGYGSAGYGSAGYGGKSPAGGTAPGGYGPNPYSAPPPKKGKLPLGLIIGGLVLLLLLGLGGWALFRPGGLINNPGGPDGPQGTQNICPKKQAVVSTRPHPNDGRVHGGRLSFPRQPAPWGEVQTDDRVPFGVDVHEQSVVVESNYNGQGSSWVSSLLVAELNSGDGFYGPKEGAEIVARCVIGKFYSDAKVDREDKRSEALSVSGHEAHLIEMHLSFDIKGLKTKGETAIIVVVDNKDGKASLYYASIPDGQPGHLQTARDVLTQLTLAS